MSKTKLFCETSSIFEVDNIKNEATLRDFLQGSKVECRAQFPNVFRTWCVLCILTSKCASCHNGVHVFNISSSKSAPTLVCCTFLLRIVLRAATVCNFSSLICPDGSAPAALASLLFGPLEPQVIGKTQCFATFLPFTHLDLLSS